jgi:hypothetical protein
LELLLYDLRRYQAALACVFEKARKKPASDVHGAQTEHRAGKVIEGRSNLLI